jgi:hypothetical protein
MRIMRFVCEYGARPRAAMACRSFGLDQEDFGCKIDPELVTKTITTGLPSKARPQHSSFMILVFFFITAISLPTKKINASF